MNYKFVSVVLSAFCVGLTTTQNTTTSPVTLTPAINVTTAVTNATTTSTNVTTATPSNATTPSNMTTSSPITTTMPPPPEGEFKIMENGKVCLIADIAADLQVKYTTKNGTERLVTIDVAKNANDSGGCAGINGSNPWLKLSFQNYNLTLDFIQKNKIAYMSAATFVFTEDEATFPDSTSPGEHTAKNDSTNLKLSATNTFFECKSGISQEVDANVTLNFNKLKIQVYGVNETFTGEGSKCAGDMKTTLSPQTSTAPTVAPAPTPKTPQAGNWSVPNGAGGFCIKAKMGIRFFVPYNTTNMTKESKIAKFDLPIDANATGSCTNTTASLVLSFFKDFELELIFAKYASKSMLGDSDMYGLQNVSFKYSLTKEQFPDATGDPSETHTVAKNNVNQFNTTVGKSYRCDTKLEIKLSDNVTLDTWSLQVQAFKAKNGTDFDASTECPKDLPAGNDIVPIAVGAALAALVVIVLIAYMIGRRRNRAGYESV